MSEAFNTVGYSLQGTQGDNVDRFVQRLADEDFLGQLLDRRGRMRELGTEDGDIKLDWVDGLELALRQPAWLDGLITEARAILDSGIRRVIWAAMGGSVQTVYVLRRMGFLDMPTMSIHPLDSSDPASVNRVFAEVAAAEGVSLAELAGDPAALRQAVSKVLQSTMMTGVSMGMTSEEPITVLDWFDGLLSEYQTPNPAQHVQVMTIPDSLLDRFARARNARMASIQLDGQSHTPGRMSAPATRVFLRPVALLLEARHRAGGPDARMALGELLQGIQARYGLTHTETAQQRHARTLQDPFIRLGAYIAMQAQTLRRNKTVLVLPPSWRGLAPWIEQVVEESLGKDGKGWLVFFNQRLDALAHRDDCIFLVLQPSDLEPPMAQELAALEAAGRPVVRLRIPVATSRVVPPNLEAVAGIFASWKLAVAAFGYAEDIVVVGQPGVEAYKAFARSLRDGPDPIRYGGPETVKSGAIALDDAAVVEDHPEAGAAIRQTAERLGYGQITAAERLAAILLRARSDGWLRYLDLTYNGDIDPQLQAVLDEAQEWIGHRLLGVPVKIRTAPSDYHSTEQSETDGPPELVSIRIVTQQHDAPLVGKYTDRFLLAQARGTWQAMRDAKRWVVLLSAPDCREVAAELRQYFAQVAAILNKELAS